MFNALASVYEDTILLVFRGHTLSVKLRSEQLRRLFKIEVKRLFDFEEKYKTGNLQMWGNGLCSRKNSINNKS